ncbi:hypothetical protein EHQ43_10070 [Leptospira bouyouniensis]|uniref:Uncharacterized protein n=1 Tax=Leptospira bouyouniensis TaxID=2484911 RepID=A0A7I0HRX3_9LEPT|nr:hypothetical protein [Leptospira bouyouniensis]TGL04981.1 hypothetical protein EHQ43_10070 [Leptospira bouyouniensis]
MVKPTVAAILFADKIIEEKTNKKAIIGTFDRVYSPSFPMQPFPWGIYLALTGILGAVKFSLILDKPGLKEPLLRVEGEIDGKEEDGIIEIPMNFSNFQFAEPGDYTLKVFVNDNVIGTRKLVVRIGAFPPPVKQG